MTRRILVADLLCGAGGSSTGCARALADLGLKMELVCVNHWGVAIETHRRNHPEARHYVQDIATVRPHLIVPEGYLDLLMASPTCTHHSVARGGKPTSDQQRSDPWHIVTWLTELRVKRIIIENVWEFISWGPVDPKTGRPIKARKGEYFRAWIETIRRLGFEPEWRKLNAANYGDATTRQRFILKARNDRRQVGWAPLTHAKRSDDLLLFPTLKPWRPAREIIDWSIRGRSIFDRKKPLAPKTLARIHAGAIKYGWPEPFLVILRNHMAAQGIDLPVPTIAARGNHIGLAEPVFTVAPGGGAAVATPVVLSQQNSGAPRSAEEPLPTITTGGAAANRREGCARPMLAEPFVLSRQGGGAPRSLDDPTPAQVAKHSHLLISSYYGNGDARSADEPLPTVTTKDRFGMVMTITHVDGSNRARDVDADPLPTLTAANRGELAFITAQHGERDGQLPRVHDIGAPTPAVTATGHIDLVEGVAQEARSGAGGGATGTGTREYDILFRMLEPHELAAAMGFDADDVRYEFAGTKTEQVKQIGNAVSVAMMKAEVKAIMADAAPKRAAPEMPQRASA